MSFPHKSFPGFWAEGGEGAGEIAHASDADPDRLGAWGAVLSPGGSRSLWIRESLFQGPRGGLRFSRVFREPMQLLGNRGDGSNGRLGLGYERAKEPLQVGDVEPFGKLFLDDLGGFGLGGG